MKAKVTIVNQTTETTVEQMTREFTNVTEATVWANQTVAALNSYEIPGSNWYYTLDTLV